MGLTQALATSLSGLQTTQTGLSIIAGNVANSQTAGYIAKQVAPIETAAGDGASGVRVSSVNRLLDTFAVSYTI
jgi:flagellar hook-associated protein 1 FlgK